MKFGKLFRALIKDAHSQNCNWFDNLSSNKCSGLTYKELRTIAKWLYNESKVVFGNDTPLCMYMRQSQLELANNVYITLKKIFG